MKENKVTKNTLKSLFELEEKIEEIVEENVMSDFSTILEECYVRAETILDTGDENELKDVLKERFGEVTKLANLRHAARGVVLTLATYKIANPAQDVRRHKAEFEGGFSARLIDSQYTVPFLEKNSLPYNVETHWLTQTFSYAGPLESDVTLKTVPKLAGPLSISVVNAVEESENISFVKAVATLILLELIKIRNKGNVALVKPKNLSINQVMALLEAHMSRKYKTNGPRLPQVALYSLYECIMDSVERYSDYELRPLERLKAANRKSGSVGDIDVELNGKPIEAVEIKHEIPINTFHVTEAIQKIKTASVERYFILSTVGIANEDREKIYALQEGFLKSNGCEIIVNGVYETIRYYLRLLRSTNDFINQYTTRLESDPDLDYEHKLAWNEICM